MEFNYGVDGINPLLKLREIVLEDMVLAAGTSISDRVIKDALFEVVRDEMRQLSHMYIKGVFRTEIIEKLEKSVVVSTPEYPASLWDCAKQYINDKLKTNFKVETTYQTTSCIVTFKRSALYPRLPSLRSEYRAGTYIIKEQISTEREITEVRQ